LTDLKIINFKGFQCLFNTEIGVYPFFSNEISFRIHHKLSTNIALTGEPGIGKSYEAIDLARVSDGVKRNGKERFQIKQIVFKQSEYMQLLPGLRMGRSIVFDEPSYSLGKRDWFKELQKALVHTLESQRFLVHPLFIPIINLSLLDKTIRNYLIQFIVHMTGRGHGIVYRIKPSQRTEKVYAYAMGELLYRQFDLDQCQKNSCLGCKKLLKGCQVFRAHYERKKRSIQFERYEQAETQAQTIESKDLTEQQLEEMLLPVVAQLLNKKESGLDIGKMRVYLRNEEGVYISSYKAYAVKHNIENTHPNLFEAIETLQKDPIRKK